VAHYSAAGSLEVFFVDGRGALRVLSKRGVEAWRPQPDRLSADGLAPPGALVAAAHHPPGRSLEVFVVAPASGAGEASIHVAWKSANVDAMRWHDAFALTDPANCPVPPAAHLAAVHGPYGGTLEVLFVDANGAVRVLFKRGEDGWRLPPQPLTVDGVAPAGAPIAAAYHARHKQLEVVVAGHRGPLLLWKVRNEPWQGPIELTEPGTVPAGVPVSIADHPPGDTLEVIVGAPDVFARVAWKHQNGWWRPCAVPIARRSGTVPLPPEVETTHVMQVTGGPNFSSVRAEGVDLGASVTHRRRHYVFFGDVPRLPERQSGPQHDADLVAVATRLERDHVELEPVIRRDGFFAPFTVRRPDLSFTPGTQATPTGAFSDGKRAYVFVLVHEGPDGRPVQKPVPGGKVVSYLTASAQPGTPDEYELVLRWSEDRFWQVAPCVVGDTSSFSVDPAGPGGVVLLGGGRNPATGINATHLAWLPLPLPANGELSATIGYYDGGTDPSRWPKDERLATAVWELPDGYTSVSLLWASGPRRWVALYSRAFWDPANGFFRARSPVVARVASTPMALGQAQEVTLFDPCRDQAYGRYMRWPSLDTPPMDPALRFLGDDPGWAYGAFALAPLTEWDSATSRLTLHYLMSTSRPYQVQLMRSRVRVTL
jgi:hypothetical protein